MSQKHLIEFFNKKVQSDYSSYWFYESLYHKPVLDLKKSPSSEEKEGF